MHLFRRVTGFRDLFSGSVEGVAVDEDDSAEAVIGDDEILLAELRIVQSLDSDGDLHVYDLSRSSDGQDLEPAKALELVEWARASVLAPMVYGLIKAYGEANG